MKKLKDSFVSAPRYSTKWENYFEIYDKIFNKYQDKKITFVEIGVGDGGSLFMWRSYFENKIRIIGIDLNIKGSKKSSAFRLSF